MGPQLDGIDRCPHCSVATPSLAQYWTSNGFVQRATPGDKHRWAVYACATCGGVLLAKGQANRTTEPTGVIEVYPARKSVHADIPEPARNFLKQAHDTLHAPDAAAVMAGSAVDAMLKQLGLVDGSLYERIDKAVADHKLTEGMGEWAHDVRLGSNRPRHADKDRPHVSADEAKQSVEFADALGYFLFVLTKRIEKGKAAAAAAAVANTSQ